VMETWSSMCGCSVMQHTTQRAFYAPIGSKTTIQCSANIVPSGITG